jgi:hypothetical protein
MISEAFLTLQGVMGCCPLPVFGRRAWPCRRGCGQQTAFDGEPAELSYARKGESASG